MNDQKILRRICEGQAIILADEPACLNANLNAKQGDAPSRCQTFAAYPYGDRRRRPVSWIDKDMLLRFLADGAVARTPRGYELAPSYSRRKRSACGGGGQEGHAHQHRQMERRDISAEGGAFRPVNINVNSQSVLRRLALHKDRAGQPYLNAAEIEAGERFCADYARAGMSAIATQKYDSVLSSSGAGGAHNRQEALSIGAIDARQRIMDALAFVGPGLDKAISAICSQDMGLEEMERVQGWARRSGKTVLKLGLQRLSLFYGTQVGG